MRAPAPAFFCNTSRGLSLCIGRTAELPPPPKSSTFAVGPITAIDCASSFDSGSTLPSFFSSTAPAIATSRATADIIGISGTVRVSSARRPAASIAVRIRLTASLTTLSANSPFFTASASALKFRPFGISISMPAFSAGAALCVAPQSDMTKPLNPQSFRRMSVSNCGCSAA